MERPIEKYVSRAGLKLAGAADKLGLDFGGKVVLDVGSSTGGFSDFALRRGAVKVIAVEVGTNQLHASLRNDPRVELHEKTDIRDVAVIANSSPDVIASEAKQSRQKTIILRPAIILIDVSFISIREILPHVAQYFTTPVTEIVAMVKPQFEATAKSKTSGVIKNDTERRKVLKDFETWAKQYFIIKQKVDSELPGVHGNRERFYLLQVIKC